jgi:hypothetical protein
MPIIGRASRIGHQRDVSPVRGPQDRRVPSYQDPTPTRNVAVGRPLFDRDDIDAKFEQAQQFIDSYWNRFDDPSGVAADLAELRLAVSGPCPTNLIRTRLTMHRLNRTAGSAAPVAAVIAIVREMLGSATR